MQVLDKDIDTLYKEIYNKYQLDKIISKQKNEFSDIDELINNINGMGNKSENNRRLYTNSNVYLSKRFYNFLSKNEVFKNYIISEVMSVTLLTKILSHFWVFNKLKNLDDEIYNSIIGLQNHGRHNKKNEILKIINNFTCKTKNISIAV
jgi:hypothetical protein